MCGGSANQRCAAVRRGTATATSRAPRGRRWPRPCPLPEATGTAGAAERDRRARSRRRPRGARPAAPGAAGSRSGRRVERVHVASTVPARAARHGRRATSRVPTRGRSSTPGCAARSGRELGVDRWLTQSVAGVGRRPHSAGESASTSATRPTSGRVERQVQREALDASDRSSSGAHARARRSVRPEPVHRRRDLDDDTVPRPASCSGGRAPATVAGPTIVGSSASGSGSMPGRSHGSRTSTSPANASRTRATSPWCADRQGADRPSRAASSRPAADGRSRSRCPWPRAPGPGVCVGDAAQVARASASPSTCRVRRHRSPRARG